MARLLILLWEMLVFSLFLKTIWNWHFSIFFLSDGLIVTKCKKCTVIFYIDQHQNLHDLFVKMVQYTVDPCYTKVVGTFSILYEYELPIVWIISNLGLFKLSKIANLTSKHMHQNKNRRWIQHKQVWKTGVCLYMKHNYGDIHTFRLSEEWYESTYLLIQKKQQGHANLSMNSEFFNPLHAIYFFCTHLKQYCEK